MSGWSGRRSDAQAALAARRESLRSDCLLCRQPYPAAGPFSYYFESSDGAASGFLEEPCFSELLLSSIFNLGTGLSSDDPRRLMLREATIGSSFVFRSPGNGTRGMVEFSRFDGQGRQMLKKLYPLQILTDKIRFGADWRRCLPRRLLTMRTMAGIFSWYIRLMQVALKKSSWRKTTGSSSASNNALQTTSVATKPTQARAFAPYLTRADAYTNVIPSLFSAGSADARACRVVLWGGRYRWRSRSSCAIPAS